MISTALFALFVSGLVAADSQCARSYTVQEGDYCDSISAATNSSTYQLAVSNYQTINDACTNLATAQVVCLGITGQDCTQTYVVQEGDYCDLIAQNHGINSTMLATNNPQIDDNCYNLYIGEVLCVANQPLVTPPPEGWTLPGTALDDGSDDSASPDTGDESDKDEPADVTTPAPTDDTEKTAAEDTKDTSEKKDDSSEKKDDTADKKVEEDAEDDEDCEDD